MNDQNRPTQASTPDVLETIRLLWERVGAWPTWGDVDFLLDTRFDIEDPWSVVRQVDRSLLWGIADQEPNDRSEVGLTVAGLALLPTAAEDLRIFIDTVRAAAELVRGQPPSEEAERLSSTDLPQLISLPAAGRAPIVRRQHSIWRTTNLWQTLGGPDPETGVWSLVIDRKTIRRCRGVASVEDYLRTTAPEHQTPSGFEARQSEVAPAGKPDASTASPPTSATAPAPASLTTALLTATEPAEPRKEVVTTSNGGTFTLFPDHLIAQTPGSQVFAGQDDSAQPVAIKRVRLRTFGTAAWYRDGRAVEREALAGAALADVDDPHVLRLLGHALDESTFTFVYPLADTSLENVVAVVAAAKGVTGRAPSTTSAQTGEPSPVHHDPAQAALNIYGPDGPDETQVRSIGLELARGLALLHTRGILHRDIKPANILRYDRRWCLADLGIARLMEEATSTYTLAGGGTPEYMPPEIFAFRPANTRSDVYSLGCTLYALLHGRPPFAGVDLSRSHRFEAPDLSAVNDQSLAVALTAMMHKDDAARPSVEEVVAMLSTRPPAALDGLGAVVLAAARKDQTRAVDQAKAEDRSSAAATSLERFRLLWRELEALVRPSFPDVGFSDGQGAWLMTVGDWRLTIQIHEPASSLCPAVQLGTVSLEVVDGPDQRTALANLVALWSAGDEAPRWWVYRMAVNQISANRVPVSITRADGDGAVSHQHLEEYLGRDARDVTAVMVTHDRELTAEALLGLFSDEVTAILRDEGSGEP